jgi:Cu(I)/Ag(I) efflux system membrane fusion protein
MNDEEQGVEKDINEGPVEISPQQEQAAGIKTTFVKKRQMFLSLKSSGSPAQVGETGNDADIATIKAQIYEGEENLIKIGQKAEITAAAHPGKKFTGSVSEVEKRRDPNNKILKISIEAQNKAGLLKPGMEVEAIIYVDLGQRLCVPTDSIFDTGEKQVVFLKKAPGKYEPADVETGYETDDYTEIASGAKDGDEIAASSTALIDLKTKLESEANAITKSAK